MYKAAVGAWGVPPRDFWAMTHGEFWALSEFHRDQACRVSGRLTPSEERELREWVNDGST